MKIGIITLLTLMNLAWWADFTPKTNDKMEKVRIEIWSDVVCPFCLLGKKKIEKAIDKLDANDKVDIVWRSFQLNPEFPQNTSLPSIKYLSADRGYPKAQVEQMCNQLELQGKNYDIDFNFDSAITFNTFDVHRLIHWAKEFNQSCELKEALMTAHFSLGIDLSSTDNILNIVENLKLDVEAAEAILKSEKYSEDVKKDIQKARQIGIQGVPFFLINGEQGISGAQQDQVFENALAASIANIKTASFTNKKGVCTQGEEVCD